MGVLNDNIVGGAAGVSTGQETWSPSSNDWDYTHDGSGEWPVAGNALGDDTDGAYIDITGGDSGIYSLHTFDGDFDIEFTLTGHDGLNFGVFPISEDDTRASGNEGGLSSMTASYWHDLRGAGDTNYYYGSSSQGTKVLADGDVIKISRNSGTITFSEGGSVYETFGTTNSTPMRLCFWAEGAPFNTDIDNILFTDSEGVQRDGFYDETQYNSSAIGNYASGSIHAGRRWIATRTGTLASLSFEVRTVSTGSNFHVELWSGTMTSPVSKVGGDTNTINITSTGKKTFTFSTEPDVTKGQVYWAVIEDEDHASTNANIALWEIRKSDIQDSGAGHNDTVTSITDSNSTAGVAAVYQMEAVINTTEEPKPDWDTLLLIHSDTSDASTTFVDSSPYGRTPTVNDDAQHDTAQKKFGASSILFDGTTDAITFPDSDDFEFPNSFTIDCWFRLNATGADQILVAKGGRGGAWSDIEWWCGVSSSNVIQFQMSNNGGSGFTMAGSTSLSTGTWYHYALVRNLENFNLYLNGTSEANTTNSAVVENLATLLYIGNDDDDNPLNGWMDEVRISNVARWDANFTPSTSPYP